MKGPVSKERQLCQDGLQPSRWTHFLLESAGAVEFGLGYKTFPNLAQLSPGVFSLSGRKKKAMQHKRGKLYSEEAKERQGCESSGRKFPR